MQTPSPEHLKNIQPGDVRTLSCALMSTAFPEQDPAPLEACFDAVEALFSGRHGDFQASDTAYHNFAHSLQVTLCWSQMLATLLEYHPEYEVSANSAMAGFAACLLHDSGYLKETGDPEGTGAKYVLVHESRSSLICRRVLKQLAWDAGLIHLASRLIAATGPRTVIEGMPFRAQTELTLAKMLGTADFLAQMADPLYLEKLPALYAEFDEFERLRGVLPKERIFPSFESLLSGTPDFWEKLVLPKLEQDYSRVYSLLNTPYPSGPNLYLLQAENNIRALRSNTLC